MLGDSDQGGGKAAGEDGDCPRVLGNVVPQDRLEAADADEIGQAADLLGRMAVGDEGRGREHH